MAARMCSIGSCATSGRSGGTTGIRSPRSNWTATCPSSEPGRRVREADVTVSEDEAGGLPAGVAVGHWTDLAGQTGCTVILAPGGAVGGVDVRGGAPRPLGTDAPHPGPAMPQAPPARP